MAGESLYQDPFPAGGADICLAPVHQCRTASQTLLDRRQGNPHPKPRCPILHLSSRVSGHPPICASPQPRPTCLIARPPFDSAGHVAFGPQTQGNLYVIVRHHFPRFILSNASTGFRGPPARYLPNRRLRVDGLGRPAVHNAPVRRSPAALADVTGCKGASGGFGRRAGRRHRRPSGQFRVARWRVPPRRCADRGPWLLPNQDVGRQGLFRQVRPKIMRHATLRSDPTSRSEPSGWAWSPLLPQLHRSRSSCSTTRRPVGQFCWRVIRSSWVWLSEAGGRPARTSAD